MGWKKQWEEKDLEKEVGMFKKKPCFLCPHIFLHLISCVSPYLPFIFFYNFVLKLRDTCVQGNEIQIMQLSRSYLHSQQNSQGNLVGDHNATQP